MSLRSFCLTTERSLYQSCLSKEAAYAASLPCLEGGKSMNEDIANDVNLVMQQIYNDSPGAQDSEPDEQEEIIHVHHFPDAILIVKEGGNLPETNIPVVESTPKDTNINQAPAYIAYLAVGIFIFITISSILFQLYLLIHPPTTTIILILKSQTVSINATALTGRLINPITLSQSATAPATGRGHQDARAATGTITFYNGQLQIVTVPAGTILTGNDGMQVITDQDAIIPALDPSANPPTVGQITVSARTTNPGARGNIPAFDISQPCCSTSVIAKNTTAFHNGQDERNFQTVTTADMNSLSTLLKTSLAQSMQGAMQGLVKPNEELQTLPCSPTITSDHRIGQEATQVKVTATETCSGVAYNQNILLSQATNLLSSQAAKKLGPGYSLLGIIHLSIIQATVSHATPILAFTCQGMWVYTLTHAAQEHLKHLIAGKHKDQAVSILSHAPGIQEVSIAEVDDNERLPKNPDQVNFQTFAEGASG